MKKTIRLLCAVAILAMLAAFGGRYLLGAPFVTFSASALALILLSKLMGDATEQLTQYVGQGVAGFFNVTLSNLAELIIIFVAVRSNLVELVQAGIVGSMIGNLLLVMGLSIYVGTRKNGSMPFQPALGMLLVNQLYLVSVTLLLPTLFADRIPQERQNAFSYLLAAMLVGAYIYYYRLSLTDQRFEKIDEQRLTFHWSKRFSIGVLIATAVGAFLMSELLVGEVEHVAHTLDLSAAFIGFIILPLLGNLAEHMIGVIAAYKKMTELSLTISVGSASQVGMVVAPCAVLFGYLTGNPITLNFTGLPIQLLGISIVGAIVVLRDSAWHKSEGIMLIALYAAIVIAFMFCL
ncbi:MAG: hypothetical protein AAB490_03805 [Patescibacteria group bacterium]